MLSVELSVGSPVLSVELSIDCVSLDDVSLDYVSLDIVSLEES